jgi:Mor family transcriptional regulator
MRRGRKKLRELCYRDKKIVNRLNTSPETMAQLARKHGVSKQRIFQILMKAKELGYAVHRPRLLARHHGIHQCEVCNKILQVADKEDLITKRQLAQLLSIDYEICSWHLNQLKGSGFVSKKFATLRSDRLAKALQYYKYNSFPPSVVGRKFGYRNFYSLLNYQKKKGVAVEKTLNLSFASLLKREEPAGVFPSVSETHS